MALPKKVTLVEVGPRDGLQNEPDLIPTNVKIEFINLLSQTGLPVIEVSSFVSPKWVPQLSDATAVLKGIRKVPGVAYPVLIPNMTGFKDAIAAQATAIAVFTAASNTFCQKNTNCSLSDSLTEIEEIINATKPYNIPIRGYISCVLGCPYEGNITAEQVSNVATTLVNLGCDQISLGDTIGTGTINKTRALLDIICRDIPLEKLAIHFHDTYGQALVNIYTALQYGISIIDSAVGGLGGCPYAPGAGGNVATEDVLYLLQGLSIETGVDLQALIKADQFIFNYLKKPSRSKIAQAQIS